MKRFFTFLLVFSLVFSPAFCLGQREASLKTIFFGDSSESQAEQSTMKQNSQSSEQSNSTTTSTTSTILQENSNLGEMTTDEIVDEIIAKTDDAKKINTETLKSLVVVKATNDILTTQLADVEGYTKGLEFDLDSANADLIASNLKVEKLDGKVDTLKEKLKNSEAFKFALVGVNYSLDDGYGATFDMGVKFNGGLMTSVGVSAPIDAFNPIDALDLHSYTFNTKLGFAW